MDIMHYQTRLQYWQNEYERLSAISPEKPNADITALLFAAADMAVRLQNAITRAVRNGNYW